MNALRNIGGADSAFGLGVSSRRPQLWGIAFFCVFSMAGLADAAEEPMRLKEIARIRGHDDAKDGAGSTMIRTTVAFSPDGKKAATAAWSGAAKGTVKVWEIPTLKEMNTFEVEERTQIPHVAWSTDGRFLAACGSKSALGPDDKVRRLDHFGTVWLWDQDGKLRRTIRHTGPVFKVFFLKDGSALSMGLGPSLLWSVKEEKEPISVPEMTLAPLDPLWDLSRRRREGEMQGLGKRIGRRSRGVGSPWIYHDVALSPDDRRILASAGWRDKDRTVLWDLETRKEYARQPWYAQKVAFSPEGRHVALVMIHFAPPPSDINHVELWDSKFSKMVWRSRGSSVPLELGGFVFSPDGGLIVASCYVKPSGLGVRLWKTSTGEEAGEFALAGSIKDDGYISSLTVSPDGKLLLVGTSKGHVIICQFPSLPMSDKPAEKKR